MPITLDEANTILATAVAKGKEYGARMSFVVVDVGGGLIAASRMDGASLSSFYGAEGKAKASAIFSRPSAMLANAAESPTMRAIMAAAGPIVPGQGGVPVYRNGVLEGAVGGGGGSGEQDEGCATAGVEAAKLSISR
jgi:uncharacterized protein GlcG (DUF336 family)